MTTTHEDFERTVSFFKGMGLNESAARTAAAGRGGHQPAAATQAVDEDLAETVSFFKGMGLSESAAQVAAAGRRGSRPRRSTLSEGRGVALYKQGRTGLEPIREPLDEKAEQLLVEVGQPGDSHRDLIEAFIAEGCHVIDAKARADRLFAGPRPMANRLSDRTDRRAHSRWLLLSESLDPSARDRIVRELKETS